MSCLLSTWPVLRGSGNSLLDVFFARLEGNGLLDLAVWGLEGTDNFGYMVK